MGVGKGEQGGVLAPLWTMKFDVFYYVFRLWKNPPMEKSITVPKVKNPSDAHAMHTPE